MKEKKKITAGKAVEKTEIKIGILGQEIARQILTSNLNLCREVFNKEQAADFTTLSAETIDKAVDRGDLKSHKCGSRVVFSEAILSTGFKNARRGRESERKRK